MTSQAPAEVEVIVTVADDHRSRLNDVAARLSTHGFSLTQSLESIGTLTGTVRDDRIQHLHGIAGVAAVERSGGVQLPPPDADIQ